MKNQELAIQIPAEEQRRFCRFDISLEELFHGNINADYQMESYHIRTEDLLAALQNIKKRKLSPTDYGKDWFWPMYELFYDDGGIFDFTNIYPPDRDEWDGLPDEQSVFYYVYYELNDSCEDEYPIDLDELINEIQTWLTNKDKPAVERMLTERQKRMFLSCWEYRPLEHAESWVKVLFRRFTDELCEANDTQALVTKAYACYGDGNAIYEQDWFASRDCLEKLMEIDPKPQYANTLGYIYYYGRCNRNTPEYEKAFKCFSIGAAGGHPESLYKLADMFMHGYGVTKNEKTAANLIRESYEEELEKFCDGDFSSSFADAAFRMGTIFCKGIGCWRNKDEAYYYLLQARFAIRKRMQHGKYYGDLKVAANIEEAIKEVLPKTNCPVPKKQVSYETMSKLLQNGFWKRHHMQMIIKKIHDGLRILFRIVPFENEAYKPKLFVTVPPAAFSGLVTHLHVTVMNIRTFMTYNKLAPKDYSHLSSDNDSSKDTDTEIINFDCVEGNDFFFYGKKVATIDADYVLYLSLIEGKKYRFASVRFPGGQKDYHYLCDIDLKSGDQALVMTGQGEKCVTVTEVLEMTESEMRFPLEQYKSVLKKIEYFK